MEGGMGERLEGGERGEAGRQAEGERPTIQKKPTAPPFPKTEDQHCTENRPVWISQDEPD